MKRPARDPEALLPLKHATYQVLLALGDVGALLGVAVSQKILRGRK